MQPPRIPIVEDETDIAELIALNLRHQGYMPLWSGDGEAAQREIEAMPPDAVALDWMLTRTSGIELARRWRASEHTRELPCASRSRAWAGLRL